MLAHANSMSSALEDSVGGGVGIAIVAYQWGWTYYLPINSEFSYVNDNKSDYLYTDQYNKTEKSNSRTELWNLELPASTKLNPTGSIIKEMSGSLSSPLEWVGIDFIFWGECDGIVGSSRDSSPSDKVFRLGGTSPRLRVTGGIFIPTDTNIHIVCGSTDVIHSWAIPGIGS